MREGGGVVEELAGSLRERFDVARRHDAAGFEPPDRLREASDVVRDHRNAGAEGPEESSALVDLRPVRKERDRRLSERGVDLALRQVAEPPLGPVAGRGAIAVDAVQ